MKATVQHSEPLKTYPRLMQAKANKNLIVLQHDDAKMTVLASGGSAHEVGELRHYTYPENWEPFFGSVTISS